jgi:hypothetical protein
MVRNDPIQTLVIVLSAFLFLGIVGVTFAHRSVTAPMKPDPIATYGEPGK